MAALQNPQRGSVRKYSMQRKVKQKIIGKVKVTKEIG